MFTFLLKRKQFNFQVAFYDHRKQQVNYLLGIKLYPNWTGHTIETHGPNSRNIVQQDNNDELGHGVRGQGWAAVLAAPASFSSSTKTFFQSL